MWVTMWALTKMFKPDCTKFILKSSRCSNQSSWRFIPQHACNNRLNDLSVSKYFILLKQYGKASKLSRMAWVPRPSKLFPWYELRTAPIFARIWLTWAFSSSFDNDSSLLLKRCCTIPNVMCRMGKATLNKYGQLSVKRDSLIQLKTFAAWFSWPLCSVTNSSKNWVC